MATHHRQAGCRHNGDRVHCHFPLSVSHAIEVTNCDLKGSIMSDDLQATSLTPSIYRVRGIPVMLDADLAAALGLETKRFNETVKRNSDLVDDRHRFQLTRAEFDDLRSQSATSNPGRGGRTYLPWAYTERGVTRVTTFVNTPEAIRASDLIVDTFLMVHKQVAAGARAVAVEDPSRYYAEPEAMEQSRALGKRLMAALNSLLDTVIDMRTGDTLGGTAQDMTARALEHLREQLRGKGLENLKLEAETRLILQEAEKVAAEVEGRKLDNLEKRIGLVQKLITMHRDMTPVPLIEMLNRFDQTASAGPQRLPAPGKGNADR